MKARKGRLPALCKVPAGIVGELRGFIPGGNPGGAMPGGAPGGGPGGNSLLGAAGVPPAAGADWSVVEGLAEAVLDALSSCEVVISVSESEESEELESARL